jgi:cellobiose-specific phosphotransferase system component IIA
MDSTLIIIKRTSTRKQLNEALRKLKNRKRFNAKKYLGSIKDAFGDAVEYQSKLRDEWA